MRMSLVRHLVASLLVAQRCGSPEPCPDKSHSDWSGVDSEGHTILCSCISDATSASCMWIAGDCELFSNGDVDVNGAPPSFSAKGFTFDMSSSQLAELQAACETAGIVSITQ